jgi:hypothetical protein
LYAEPGYHGEVGSHFVGPTWESKSGSKVKATRVQDTGCTPDSSAIAWILLKKTEQRPRHLREGHVQSTDQHDRRLGPAEPGTLNELREVPYTAEYYFYREQ